MATIVPFEMPRPHAEELIHKLAREGEFTIEPACKAKMLARDFSMRQVLTTIEQGSVNQGPTKDECGDWRCRVKKRVAGRLVRVVVAINNSSFLYLISVH